jgi:hypothetical protein
MGHHAQTRRVEGDSGAVPRDSSGALLPPPLHPYIQQAKARARAHSNSREGPTRVSRSGDELETGQIFIGILRQSSTKPSDQAPSTQGNRASVAPPLPPRPRSKSVHVPSGTVQARTRPRAKTHAPPPPPPEGFPDDVWRGLDERARARAEGTDVILVDVPIKTKRPPLQSRLSSQTRAITHNAKKMLRISGNFVSSSSAVLSKGNVV